MSNFIMSKSVDCPVNCYLKGYLNTKLLHTQHVSRNLKWTPYFKKPIKVSEGHSSKVFLLQESNRWAFGDAWNFSHTSCAPLLQCMHQVFESEFQRSSGWWSNLVAARKFASATIEKQMESFRHWGVMADWTKPYRTYDPEYVVRQLTAFYDLYEKVGSFSWGVSSGQLSGRRRMEEYGIWQSFNTHNFQSVSFLIDQLPF